MIRSENHISIKVKPKFNEKKLKNMRNRQKNIIDKVTIKENIAVVTG